MRKALSSSFEEQLTKTISKWTAMLPADRRKEFEADFDAIAAEHVRQLDVIERATTRGYASNIKDEITGLVRRKYCLDYLRGILAGAPSSARPALGVILLDLDDFKPINDLHGHAAGDAALQEVAQVLHHGIRDSDFAARLGGDEFAVLLDHSSIVDAEQWAIRQLEQLRGTKLPCSPGRALRASIGVAEIAPGTTIESVMSAADEALYRAKRDGRGCVRRAGGTS